MDGVRDLLDPESLNRLGDFYRQINGLASREPPWDSIWCRVVKNNFSPRGFGKVDYIVGNLPWVRWSRLPITYRRRVQRFCDHYGLVSGRTFAGGIESDISTVIGFSVADHWLNPDGRIGLLITWTVFKSASARGFREGALPDESGIRIDKIEDLSAIQAFPDATNETGIYYATKVASSAHAIFDDIPCDTWYPIENARINPTTSLPDVKRQVSVHKGEACPVSGFGSPLWTGDLHEFNTVRYLRGTSPYFATSHRGTVNDLARVYWLSIIKYSDQTNRALIRTLTPEEFPRARLVEPTPPTWIEADVLFPLLRGLDTGRYGIRDRGWYQIIPNQHYRQMQTEEEFRDTFPLAYAYLIKYQALLVERSSYKRYQQDAPPYAIWCIGDYSFAPYKVVWPEQQNPKTFRASVVSDVDASSELPNRVIVPDHKLYFATFHNEQEAHYVCAFLNSRPVRTWLGGFLLGKQIGTSIFEYMNLPQFDPADQNHLDLASISMQAHKKRKGTANKRLLSDKAETWLEHLVEKVTMS